MTDEQKVAKLAPDFRFLMAEEEQLPLEVLVKVYDLGYTTSKLFAKFDSDEAGVKAGIESDLKIKASDGPQQRILVAKLLAVWETCKERLHIKQKYEAAATANNEAKPWSRPEHMQLVANFTKEQGWQLKDAEIPAPSYLEKRSDEIEHGELIVETLAQVISKEHGIEESSSLQLAKDGTLKMKKGLSEAPMPTNPEELRARIKLWGYHWILLKYKFPLQARLQTATLRMFDEYLEYLLGEDVYGLTARNAEGQVVSRPSFLILISYDFRMRKRMTELINEGSDIKKALEEVVRDMVLRERHFTTPAAMSALSGSSFTMTGRGKPSPTRELPWMRGLKDEDKKKKKIKNKNKGGRADESGVKDVIKDPKGKGKGKDKGKRNSKTPDGKPLCYKWNNGEGCKGPCKYVHACQKCFGKHPFHLCTQE